MEKVQQGYDAKGHEVPDPTPIEVPAGLKRPPTLQEQIKRLIRTHISDAADRHGLETLEEANDFDIDDEDAADGDTSYTIMAQEVERGMHRVSNDGDDQDEVGSGGDSADDGDEAPAGTGRDDRSARADLEDEDGDPSDVPAGSEQRDRRQRGSAPSRPVGNVKRGQSVHVPDSKGGRAGTLRQSGPMKRKR